MLLNTSVVLVYFDFKLYSQGSANKETHQTNAMAWLPKHTKVSYWLRKHNQWNWKAGIRIEQVNTFHVYIVRNLILNLYFTCKNPNKVS